MKLRIEGADANLFERIRYGNTKRNTIAKADTTVDGYRRNGGNALAESDAQLKAKLLGYWLSPRHAYLIQANGLMRMCPTTGPDPATTANRWDVRNGMFYQDDDVFKIVRLTKTEFDHACTKDIGVWADGKYIVTAPAGSVFRLSRTTRARAEKD